MSDVVPIPILIYPDPALKARNRPVVPADREQIAAALPRMFAAMYGAPGIGLAAPQVGLALRFFIVDLMPNDAPAPLTLLNPTILARSTEMSTREEGCLSLPNQYADVTRPAQVRIAYQDLDGARHEIDADGLLATCLQHELDHLDGVLFTDHLSPLKRNMLVRRLAKGTAAEEHLMPPARLRLAFMGSPAFAVPALRALHQAHDIVAVYCQPPRAAGRGQSPRRCAVHEAAEASTCPCAPRFPSGATNPARPHSPRSVWTPRSSPPTASSCRKPCWTPRAGAA